MPAPLIILIADDDAVSRLVLGHMLRRMGHETVDADSVATAVSRFDEVRPALVIADFMMSDGTGLDLLSALRSRPGPPPFVLVTGEGGQAGLDDERAGLIDRYLTKPVGSQELRDCVDLLTSDARPD